MIWKQPIHCGLCILDLGLLLALVSPLHAAEDEWWGIRCITLTTPDRFKQAEAYADALKRVKGLQAKLVQIVHDESETAVFYGKYRRVYGPDGPTDRYEPNHLPDLELIRTLRSEAADVWPFRLASMDLLPTHRPKHPEWDVKNADGYWSLHVAVFYNTQDFRSRRTAAEEYCALLRKQGEEAYYDHGPVNSSVYVGTFPPDAVTEFRQENPLSGVVETSRRMVDERMIAAQKRFPESLQNGHKVVEVLRAPDGTVKERVPVPSFPVILPKAEKERKVTEPRRNR